MPFLALRRVGENLSGALGAIIPSYRENTIRSFQRAVALGVKFVEFDVQVMTALSPSG